MVDGLFDKRYRYDFIYPRGRSGETLRAIDTQDNDRPVVVKRPAALDAPPIRAGQEVSITNERKALKQLTGHPVLAELLGEGQFMVGGTAHQYIVIERAMGVVVADAVVELNAIGERLPMLEILTIVDNLLDLLNTAHAKGIVYNDVDAKHLFWNRDTYSLKMIDWGNAVFLEGDDITPQGISRQTDIYQVGQMLYYLVTGGRRADVPRDADSQFLLDFGEDSRRVHSRMQEMISKALHPVTRLRYANINSLRADLTTFRQPLERERNAIVNTVVDKLRREDLSKNDLRTLKTTLEPALQQDPAYPVARQAHESILDRLRDLAVEADLDATRIYMEAESWVRAQELLTQLKDKAGSQTAPLISFLQDTCEIMLTNQVSASDGIRLAIGQMFKGMTAQAGKTLMLNVPKDDTQYRVQWLIAERISSHFSDVLLLRPNLYRLTSALEQLEREGYTVAEPKAVFNSVEKTLDTLPTDNIDLHSLRDGYRSVVEQLTLVNPLVQTFAMQHQLSNKQMPLNALERALYAAMALADAMHVIGKQATRSPREATNALEISRTVDPTNAVWEDVQYLLNQLYERLQSYQTYVPSADGTDLAGWLKHVQVELSPFSKRLFDELLSQMLVDIDIAENTWQGYREAVIQGDRENALDLLDDAISAVATIAPALSAWFKHVRVVIEGANYIERHSVPNPIGRAIADGWEAFDRGRLSDAERLGQQAYEIAKGEAEYEVAKRLQDIAALTREWVERNGIASAQRTQVILNEMEKRFTSSEKEMFDSFSQQMPSIETYLKVMSRGLVDVMARNSTGGLRLVFMKYVLLGALDTHENRLIDAEFWREASVKTLADAARHPATRALDELITRKKDMNSAQALFARVNGKQALSDLENIRRQLDANPQAKLLGSGVESLRDVETALRHWSDGDFRSAGMKLESAVKGINEVEQNGGFTLIGYRAWVMELMGVAAELLVQYRETRGIIEQRPDTPDHRVYDCFHDMVRVTTKMLGDDYAGTLRTWRDGYDQFLEAYTADERRSKRMERMNELFRAMFIDRHPAYALYRHWYSVLERSPEFPAPPTTDPTPRIANEDAVEVPEFNRPTYNPPKKKGMPTWLKFVLAIGIIGLVAGGVFLVSMNSQTPVFALTISPTPTQDPSVAIANVNTTEAPTVVVLTNTTAPTNTARPSNTPQATATETLIVPTDTPAPSNTPLPTATPSNTPTPLPPTATPLPPEGVRGTQDLLALFNSTPNLGFNPEFFLPIETGYRLGIGEASPGEIIRIAPEAELLESAYGNDATSRIRRVDAEMSLRTFNPSVVSAEDVFFGILLESATDGNNIGIRVEVVGDTVINLYSVINNETTFLSQKSVNTIVARLRIDRDPDTGNVILYYNDQALDDPLPFLAGDAEVVPMVFVREGGVVIGLSNWEITLR
jgi:serine/threonine protein kinase